MEKVDRSRLPSEMHFAFQTKGTRSDTKHDVHHIATSVISSLQEVRKHGAKEAMYVGEDKEQRVLLSIHLRLGYLPSGYDTAMESIMQYGCAALQPLCVVRWTEHTHTLTTHHLDHPIHKPSSKLSGLQVRRQPETL